MVFSGCLEEICGKMADVDMKNLREFEDDDIEVIKFKSESLKEELNKFVFSGVCDQVSSTYHLDKDLSKGHEAVLFMIKNFSKNKKFEEEYIKRLYYHDLSRSVYRVSPANVDHEFIITQARDQVFKKAIQMKEFHAMKTAIRFLEDPKIMNPYGKPIEEKFNWLDFKDKVDADFLYFIGSADLFFNHERVKKMMFLLEKLGISFTISRDEQDCGYLARVLGRLNSADKLKEMNKEMILRSGLKNVITSDPHCYIELQQDLESSDITVWYLTELISNKIFSLNSKQLHKTRMKVVFQDSTILPPKMDKLAPRILSNIGCDVIETPFSKENSLSTGEGGGFSLNYPEDSLRIANMRLEEAKEAGAEAIISDSPHDFSNLNKAKKKYSSKIKVYDLLTLVSQAVKWTSS